MSPVRISFGLVWSQKNDMVLGRIEVLAEVMGKDAATERNLARTYMKLI